MILNNTPANEAVISNAGEASEFRIRNSAKAFNILSNGLYSNKIRAIIRELSCNAVDSHIAAGKPNLPFDVHLPNYLEPWFSIRDYGTGLDYFQITEIYTTYFESTKTGSNDFIGALGLGSKSPFSYTDNFTITAIKDGRKWVFSAFINNEGKPSIVPMMLDEHGKPTIEGELTNEPTGVEIKFSVNDRYDFGKFIDESVNVFQYFKLRPIVSGCQNFQFKDSNYNEKDIAPGIHSLKRESSCVAVMGNIGYPINVPNSEKNLGELAHFLKCGIEIHFDIGELDFQASREGLSYIPQTIDAIKKKFELLNSQLIKYLSTEVSKISSPWDQAIFLNQKRTSNLWKAAASQYITDNNHVFFNLDSNSHYFLNLKKLKIASDELKNTYNISIRGFKKTRTNATCHQISEDCDSQTQKKYWSFYAQSNLFFVKTDTKVGALERAKYHWRNNNQEEYENMVFVLEAFDKKRPALYDKFLESIFDPPNVLLSSSLNEKQRVKNESNISILKLETHYRKWGYRGEKVTWKKVGCISDFDQSQTYYYLPISAFSFTNKQNKKIDVKVLQNYMKNCGISTLNVDIYGVRKNDVENVKSQPNWINLEDLIEKEIKSVLSKNLLEIVAKTLDYRNFACYNNNIITNVNQGSPYIAVTEKIKGRDFNNFFNANFISCICDLFDIPCDIKKIKQELIDEHKNLLSRYPLLEGISPYNTNYVAIAEYINLIDKAKGV